MIKWRVIRTDATGRGTGEEFELRWQAEEMEMAWRDMMIGQGATFRCGSLEPVTA